MDGLQPLTLQRGKCLVHMPSPESFDAPLPLVVMLHGAGGDARSGIGWFLDAAAKEPMILAAPSSASSTWDLLHGGFGVDAAFIDELLGAVFDLVTVDTDRLALGGFSDGASYALSLGLGNGDLFSHLIAFSPGFMAPAVIEGAPKIFVSHGVKDRVLPIERTSRRLVPQLERDGYVVTYDEFAGAHTVPHDVKQRALTWFLGPQGPGS